MPSLSSIRHAAAAIAKSSQDPDVKTLADLVDSLAAECANIKQKAEEAKEQADKARRDSKHQL